MTARHFIQRVATVLLCSVAIACTRQGAATAGGDSSMVASLERGPCRGFCPEYRVEVYQDGTVKFDGRKNVKSTGPSTRTIAASEVQALLRTIGATAFASADSAYTYGRAVCGQYYTDQPVVTLSAKVGSAMKTVQRDPGCNGAPAYLKALEARVDSVAGTSAWITGN